MTLRRPTTTQLFKECNLDMIGNLDLNFYLNAASAENAANTLSTI